MGVDAPLFIFSLVDEGYLLFLVVYFVSFPLIYKNFYQFIKKTIALMTIFYIYGDIHHVQNEYRVRTINFGQANNLL